ncbi:NAD-dependent DNA ligase [Plesiomonas shigelloides]|nr:NAD-dependent DNA ligase [Plesiomonas shigelloides]
MMSDHSPYRQFMGKSELDKAINSLLGLVEGITIDARINDSELLFLEQWLQDHTINANRHPFNELLPLVADAISDKVLTNEEVSDIKWLCNKLMSTDYYNAATADMQRLHAILAGVGSDALITLEELDGLLVWLEEHRHLKTCWPYDEVESLISKVIADRIIDSNEHKALMRFFGEFVSILDNKTIVNPLLTNDGDISGLCSICPEIEFSDAVFCLTGTSYKYSRHQFKEVIEAAGGLVSGTVNKSVDYLIVGADGNPCWAYSCYGRKVEKAVELRKKGHSIVIVHENDLHDAIEDL